MRGSSPDRAIPRALSSRLRSATGTRHILFATTEPASTCSMPRDCLVFFSAYIPHRNLTEPGLGWRRSSESSTDTGDASGRKAKSIEAPRSILRSTTSARNRRVVADSSGENRHWQEMPCSDLSRTASSRRVPFGASFVGGPLRYPSGESDLGLWPHPAQQCRRKCVPELCHNQNDCRDKRRE